MPNLSVQNAPRALEIQKSFITVNDLIQTIYGFLTVSEVLKLRLTSRQFNEAALQTQEDLVDETRAAAAIRNLAKIRKRMGMPLRLDVPWEIDLPVPSIIACHIQNSLFRKHIYDTASGMSRVSKASAEDRHLLVLMDTLRMPMDIQNKSIEQLNQNNENNHKRRSLFFSLIAEKTYTATDLCNRSIAPIEERSRLLEVIDKLYQSLSLYSPISFSRLSFKEEKKKLIELIESYYDPTNKSQQAQTKLAIKKQIDNFLIHSEYHKAKRFYQGRNYHQIEIAIRCVSVFILLAELAVLSYLMDPNNGFYFEQFVSILSVPNCSGWMV